MKSAPLSAEQRHAVETFGENICVIAGAGSGKTTVLAARYLRTIFERKIEPNQALAITFTDKAAGEMKTRLIEACHEKGLEDLRRRLEYAPISTIHSFCAKLLREHPIEFGIDPYFRILGDGEREMLSQRCVDRVFEENGDRPFLASFLAAHGEEEVRGALLALYDAERASGGAGIWKESPRMISEKDAAENLRKNAQDVLDIYELEKSVSKTGQNNILASQHFLEALRSNDPAGWQAFESLYSAAMTFSQNVSERIKACVREAQNAAFQWLDCRLIRLGADTRRQFLEIFFKYRADFDAEKRKRAAYDFEDLLFLVYSGLSSSRSLKEKMRRLDLSILVDEYQDTSPLEAAIVQKMVPDGQLFVVGDPKQSIYSFRYADPKLFYETAEKSAVRSLNENYRSRKEILDFVNTFFSDLFGSAAAPLEPALSFPPKKEPCLEILSVPYEKEEDAEGGLDRARLVEARSLAARLRAIYDSGMKVTPKAEAARPIAWRDMAVLFWRMTKARYFEEEFAKVSIPCYSRKGLGFYEKNEISDLISCLRFLERPGDEIALAATLRSPLVGVTDDALFWLGRFHAEEKIPFSETLSRIDDLPQLSDKDRVRIRHFAELSGFLRKSKERLGLAHFIRRLIEETHYEAKVLAWPEGRQAYANVLKFVELARDFQKTPGATAGDFVHYLKTLDERREKEREASLAAEKADVVTFSTIHGAKGLEFPLVVMADLGAGQKNDKRFYRVHPSQGFGMKYRSPVSKAYYPEPIFKCLDEIHKKSAAEEENRLCYVGMTRAREHLILSGAVKAGFAPGKNSRPPSSWMEKILSKGLSLRPIDCVPEGSAKAEVFSFAGIPLLKEKFESGIPLTSEDIMQAGLSAEADGVETISRKLEMRIKPYDRAEDVTVSSLIAESAGQEPWLELKDEEASEGEETDEERLPRNDFGTAFHLAMEITARGVPRGVFSKRPVQGALEGLSPKEAEELCQSAEAFWQGDWGERVRKSRRVYPELPFIYKTRCGILKGQMDLVFQDEKGHWNILDYKTNRVSSGTKEKIAAQYEYQLGLYALTFKNLFGEAPRRGVLYFSALPAVVEFNYSEEDFKRFENFLYEKWEKLAAR